jgi:phage terminase small subunit
MATSERRPPRLTAQQIRFAQYIVTDGLSQAAAYLKAGFDAKETPEATSQAAYRLVKNRYVSKYIEHLQKVAATVAELTVEEIAAGVANIARADRRGMFDKAGRLLPPDQWPDDVADTLESAEMGETTGPGRKKTYLKKVKTSSRLAAWAKLMEWRRMTGTDKAADKHDGPDKLTIGEDG